MRNRFRCSAMAEWDVKEAASAAHAEVSHALSLRVDHLNMAHAKDTHYWTQLRSVLTAGQWDEPLPAKAPKGKSLPWSELLRKFNKHCKGFSDVAEIASQTQALSLLLGAYSHGDDGNDGSDTDHELLALGDECLLPEERVDEAGVGYEILKNLKCIHFDVSPFQAS